jgi:LysR family transcriptional regulator of gallate degradation
VQVSTNESPFNLLALELRAGDLDFVFGALRSADYASDLHGEELLTEEMVILVRRGHPLLGREVTTQDLMQAHWILPRADSPARMVLDAHFNQLGNQALVPMVETGDLAIIRGLLMRSDMLAVVSEHQLEHEIASGEFQQLPVRLGDTARSIGLIYRSNGLHSPMAEALIECVRAVVTSRATPPNR